METLLVDGFPWLGIFLCLAGVCMLVVGLVRLWQKKSAGMALAGLGLGAAGLLLLKIAVEAITAV